jgi:hypothetical protein
MRVGRAKNYLLQACAVVLLASCAATAPPTETYDGLVLVPNTRFAQVYRRPGVDLSTYDTVGLTNCSVAFRQNWLRDQNSSSLNMSNRVTEQDVNKIKQKLGAECEATFRAALNQAPPYKVVDQFNDGEHVLVLRPSIINLDINAPDIMTAGRQRTYTTEAGEMTLLLEALDATTGEILVRVVDRRRDSETSYLQWTNSVTNQADAKRILNRWGQQFREGLDAIMKPATGP